ncbi:MAG: NUDIX hydrolase [Acidimicrobiales bacterium]|nr:NUDIX hydrolase [Acidimicrobiales bacterium]
MHRWLVGGALIEGPGGLLLVQNRRRGGQVDWSPPGGVIDEGESVLEGLAREVLEETGLVVTAWEGPVYSIEAEAPGLGWTLTVEVHRAVAYEGDLLVDDPDGIVVDACFVDPAACADRLTEGHPWVREPLVEWLGERWVGTRGFGYRVDGDDLARLTVSRL